MLFRSGTSFSYVMRNLNYKGISLEGIIKHKRDFLDTTENLYGDKEIWKDISGFEGIYQASNYGRVKSIVRYKKMLKTSENTEGYLRVCLTDRNHKKHTIALHRIIAKTFLRLPNKDEQVNHINGDKKDNRVENLEWCTQSENMKHAFMNNMIFRGKGKESQRAIEVNQYDLDGRFIKKWECIEDVRRELGISTKNIPRCCKGKSKTAEGYIWKYAKEGRKK